MMSYNTISSRIPRSAPALRLCNKRPRIETKCSQNKRSAASLNTYIVSISLVHIALTFITPLAVAILPHILSFPEPDIVPTITVAVDTNNQRALVHLTELDSVGMRFNLIVLLDEAIIYAYGLPIDLITLFGDIQSMYNEAQGVYAEFESAMHSADLHLETDSIVGEQYEAQARDLITELNRSLSVIRALEAVLRHLVPQYRPLGLFFFES